MTALALALALATNLTAEDAAAHFPALDQLLAQARLGNFVSAYRAGTYPPNADKDAKPTVARNVFIVHQGAVKAYRLGSATPLPSMKELIAGLYPSPQFCSRAAVWENFDPANGLLLIQHKPDPWVAGTPCFNLTLAPVAGLMTPFEPLGWLESDAIGDTVIDWRDWSDRTWIDGRFRKLLRGAVDRKDDHTRFDLALYSMEIDKATGKGRISEDKDARLAVDCARRPDLANMTVVERLTFGRPPDDSSHGGAYVTFAYELRNRPDGPVPVMTRREWFDGQGHLVSMWELESLEFIDKAQRVDLCIDPGLAKRIWDLTYKMEIETK